MAATRRKEVPFTYFPEASERREATQPPFAWQGSGDKENGVRFKSWQAAQQGEIFSRFLEGQVFEMPCALCFIPSSKTKFFVHLHTVQYTFALLSSRHKEQNIFA